jgi:hypothetical protein
LLPTTQDRCEFHELGAHRRPFRLGELALNALFDGTTGGSLKLPFTVGAIDAHMHKAGKEKGCYRATTLVTWSSLDDSSPAGMMFTAESSSCWKLPPQKVAAWNAAFSDGLQILGKIGERRTLIENAVHSIGCALAASPRYLGVHPLRNPFAIVEHATVDL